MRKLLVVGAALSLGACVTMSGSASPVWLKPEDVDDAQASALVQACLDQTAEMRAPQGPAPHSPPSSGAAGAMGAAFGSGLAQGLADGAARRRALDACLGNAGFRAVLLSPDQRASLRELEGAERLAFLEAAYEAQKPGVSTGLNRPLGAIAADAPPAGGKTEAAMPPEAPTPPPS